MRERILRRSRCETRLGGRSQVSASPSPTAAKIAAPNIAKPTTHGVRLSVCKGFDATHTSRCTRAAADRVCNQI